jgi:actin beta/gamma 1
MSASQWEDFWDEHEAIIVDVGKSLWKAGPAGGDGPSVAIDSRNREETDASRWQRLFEELELSPEETPVLLSEAPGTSRADREATLQLLFGELRVPALYIVAPSLLTAYASDMVTGIVVDIGERSTTVWSVFDGYPLLPGTTVLPIGGGHCTDVLLGRLQALGYTSSSPAEAEVVARKAKEGHVQVPAEAKKKLKNAAEVALPDGSTVTLSGDDLTKCGEVLLRDIGSLSRAPSASKLRKDTLSGAALETALVTAPEDLGVVQAILGVVALADMSMRGALLANVRLVGGGSLLSGLPERLELDLSKALGPKSPFKPRVHASGARRYAPWMGGAVMCNLSACKRAFVLREQYEAAGAEAVHLRYALLGAASLEEQRRLWQAAVADEAAANAEVALTTAREIGELAGAARAWWLEAAPAHSAVERERQTRLQRALVEPLVRAMLQQVLGATPSPPARRQAQHGAFVSGAPPFPPSAVLAAAAGALRLSLGTSAATEDAFALRRLTQLRSAAWAVQMAPVAARLDEIASRSDSHEACRAWRLWATLASKQGVRRRRLADALALRASAMVFGHFGLWVANAAVQHKASDQQMTAFYGFLRANLRGWHARTRQNRPLLVAVKAAAAGWLAMDVARGWRTWRTRARLVSHERRAAASAAAARQRAAWQAWLSFALVGSSAAVVARGGAHRALSLGISCWISMLQGRLAAVRRAHKAGERAARAGMASRFEAWREALALTKLQAELLRMAHRGLLSRWTRAWGQAGREREARRDASRRLQARSMADAIPARPLRRCWHSWHGRATVAQRLAARVSTALLARMHRYWIEWRVWASSVERRSAVRLLTTLAISSRRRWCWQAWLRASLRVQRARVLTARSQLHHDRSAVRRVLRVLENRRDSITLALLVTMVGRLSAPLIADWVVAGAAARHAIGRALKLASELARRMGWRRWQRERTRSAEGRLLLHRARRLYSTLSAAKLGHGFQQWSVTVLSTSLRNAALEHWAEEFKPRAFANYGWRRWRAGLHRQAMAAHMASVLERRADEFAKARCAAALAMWSAAATRRLHRRMLKTRKKVAQQDDAAVERLRGLLADGRKWAERMLVADGVLPAGSPLGYPFI